jgi:hypothetical protein
MNSGTPDGKCMIYHRTNELAIKRYTVSDGQDTSLVKERNLSAHTSSCLSSSLLDLCSPDQLKAAYKESPQDSVSFRLYWLSEELDWSGTSDASLSPSKEHRGAN